MTRPLSFFLFVYFLFLYKKKQLKNENLMSDRILFGSIFFKYYLTSLVSGRKTNERTLISRCCRFFLYLSIYAKECQRIHGYSQYYETFLMTLV